MKPSQRLKKYLRISRIRKLYNKVKSEFEKRGPICHNWDHIYRVLINAILIGEEEDADMDIVIPAILLHDVGFLYDPDFIKHAEIGAKKCVEWLEDWEREDCQRIAECIKTHKGKSVSFKEEPKTLEAKVIHDADQLEKMGYMGLFGGVRALTEFAQSSHPEFRSLYKIAKRLSTVKKIKFYTDKAREIVRKRRGGLRFNLARRALKELEEYEG